MWRECESGLSDRSLVELERPAAFHTDVHFPPHTMRPGDVVVLEEHVPEKRAAKSGKGASGERAGYSQRGVVYSVSDTRLTVAIDDNNKSGEEGQSDAGLPGSLRVLKLMNEVTFDRMERTLDSLTNALGLDAPQGADTSMSPSPVIASLLGLTPLAWDDALPEWSPINERLNASQVSAISFALRAKHAALIHGPPGTGKTTALAELIVQLATLHPGKSILVCGASNLAVDNVLERVLVPPTYRDALQRVGAGVTRIGHPARVLQRLSAATLDVQSAYSSEGQLVRDVARELDELMRVLTPSSTPRAGNKSARTAPRPKGPERRQMWDQVRELRREYRKRERALTQTVLQRARIVMATCHGAGGRQLDGRSFDYVIIDEACQALEASCWTAILKLAPEGRLILAGDPCQLPPTVKGEENSTPAKPDGKSVSGRTLRPPATLETTLFDRMLAMYGDGCKALLTEQYRMNLEIMAYPNEAMYDGQLCAAESCRNIRLKDLDGYEPESAEDDEDAEATCAPLVFYDTAGSMMYEKLAEGGEQGSLLQTQSRCNENEMELVERHIAQLVEGGLPPERITVLSPYASQVALLSAQLRRRYEHAIDVGTIDGMQGRENDVVVLSLVRSNEEHEVGFLRDRRRLNVAMTRAKRQLVVVGDSDTIGGSSRDTTRERAYLRAWMEHLHSNALVEMTPE